MQDYKRSTNFSQMEIDLLVNLVTKYKNVVECKRTDSATWRQKEEAWMEICKEFNSINVEAPRTVKNLKIKFENLKKNAKKKFSLEKQEIFKTGGGTQSIPDFTPTDDAIKDILTIAVTGLDNHFDSDSITADSNKENVLEEPESVIFESIIDDIQLCHSYSIQEQAVLPGSSTTDSVESEIPITGTKQWASWNPSDLKKKKSSPLCVKRTSLSTDIDTPKHSAKRKRTDLTTDCRIKINPTVSEAKLELLQLQKDSVKLDIKLKEQQIQHSNEIHALKVQQLKLEMSKLKQL